MSGLLDVARQRQASTPRSLTRDDYAPGPSYAATLWEPSWLEAHCWRDPEEPDAPGVAEICVTGAAGTGKTRNTLEWLHRELITYPKCRVLLAREYREDQTQGAMKTFEKEVVPEGVLGDANSHAPIRWHTGQQAYLYPNGSELVVKGLRDSHGIYSQQYDHIFVNEAGGSSIGEADWDQLKRAKRNGRTKYSLLIGDMNPEYEMHWLHQRCDDGATIEIRTTHADNPAVTRSYLHDLSTMRDQAQRARLFLGQRVSHRPGAYYQEQLARARLAGRIKAIDPQAGVPTHTCWDLGWSDDTAIWFFQRVGAEWHWVDYYENHQQDLDHYTAVLARKTIERRMTYGRHYLPHDAKAKTLASKGKSIEDQLRALGVSGVVVPNTALQAQHSAVRTALDTSYFDDATWVKPQDGDSHREGVRWGLQRLLGYHAEKDERTGLFKPNPVHDINSHGASALATGVVGYTPMAARAAPTRQMISGFHGRRR